MHGGFVNVSNDQVIVLSDVAELPEQIDVPRAQEAKARAEAALRANEHDEDAAAALARANTRLEVGPPSAGSVSPASILTAKALLDRNPKAAETDIRQALSTVLCRCFTHTRMLRAIKRYADEVRA